MSTAAISLRQSTIAPKGAPAFEHAEEHRVESVEDARTEPPEVLRFEHEVARFQRAVGVDRDAARRTLVTRIVTADCPDEYVETALQTFISSARPGRLDDAVDVLAQAGPILPQFVCEVLSQPHPAEPDEDYWYVLIRALGKSKLPSACMFVNLLWPKSPEGAVEALGDLADAKSLERLRVAANGDPSDFIRQMAAEIIDECSE